MSMIEKTGMLVNGAGEVLGWVNAGEECELKEGDVVVSHNKTAEKMGLTEKYTEMKAANKPVKAAKEKSTADGESKPRTRKIIPKTGKYTVVKMTATRLKEGEEAGARHALLTKLFSNTSFEAFFDGAPEKFEHPGRDGVMKEHRTSSLVGYALDRGMIELA
jgi:hypothetical protein